MDKLILGTWYVGESKEKYNSEVEAIQYAIESRISHIDTAEMYGEGLSESLIGDAIKDYDREELVLISKVYPHNCNKNNIYRSIENSLKRLRTDYLDYYLLHWINYDTDFKVTIDLMEDLKRQKLIKDWGVSNFDLEDMMELLNTPGGENCRTNQVLYNLASRGIEYDLLPFLKSINMSIMAYCPLAHGLSLNRGLKDNTVLKKIAEKHNKSIPQIMLNFVIGTSGVHGVVKSVNKKHIDEIIDSLDIELDNDDHKLLNAEFPSPDKKVRLEIV